MVLEAVACKHCGLTQQVKRHGITPTVTQRYRCYDCGRTFVKTYSRKACDPSVQKHLALTAIVLLWTIASLSCRKEINTDETKDDIGVVVKKNTCLASTQNG